MSNSNSSNIRTHHLNDGWRFREVRADGASPDTALPWLPAQVPGHVHLDLMNSGVIPDPFNRIAERGVQWVDEADWVYERIFHLDHAPADHTLLVFEGLDTIAEIDLNDSHVGDADNMLIGHEFEVGPLLRYGEGDAGDNYLRVTFRSARRVGRERLDAWTAAGVDRHSESWYRWSPRSFVRKAQYMYGWDWGPELCSCGIWRPVKLVEVPAARLLDYRVDTVFAENGPATVGLEVFVDRSAGAASEPLQLTVEFARAGNEAMALDVPLPAPVTVDVPTGQGRVRAAAIVTVDDPQLWWPNRHNPTGAGIHPTLYTVKLGLTHASKTLDNRTIKIGLRTIELVQELDSPDAGSASASFKFRVNGQDIFAKGANWIPSDSFPSRLENEGGKLDEGDFVDDRVYNLLWDACDAGYNMLRVWGGGLYESDHFYELCDEHGILVWQDFGYGCAYYPDTGAYADAARREASDAVRRLRGHACLALWCGNNENDWMYHAKWGNETPPRFLGENLYHDVLPSVIAEEDPSTPYWPSSPFGGDGCNSADSGDRHNWDVWHGIGDWTHYAADNARFVSEFGFASSCGLAAWDTCLDEDDKSAYSSAVRWHDKTRKGYDVYLGMVKLHYPEMETLEDLVYYTQLNQADALKFGIEHYRRLKGRCWGTLFWQINDCWPVQSWAVVDSELQPKAAFYASRQFYAPVLLSLKRDGDSVEVHVVNDALGPVVGAASVALKTFEGELLAEASFDVGVHCNDKDLLGTFDLAAAAGRENRTYVTGVLTSPDGGVIARNLLLLDEPKNLALASPVIGIDFEEHDEESIAVILKTDTFTGSVWLFVDPEETAAMPEFSDNFFHLEAGETRVVLVGKTDDILSGEDLRELLRVRTLYGEE